MEIVRSVMTQTAVVSKAPSRIETPPEAKGRLDPQQVAKLVPTAAEELDQPTLKRLWQMANDPRCFLTDHCCPN